MMPPAVPVGSDPATPVPGDRVGRYVIESQIGAGGMGIVFAARDPELGRRVALKLVRADAPTDAVRARMVVEAQAMARIDHPNVVTIHDAGVHGRGVFLAMELVEGATLRGWLAAEPRSWRDILAVVVGAGRGLAAAHASGIVHRDVKPDNVLVAADGRARITDFGIARADEESADSSAGALLGTPAYMSPEQHLLRPADARSDQFGLCVMMHEALYGQRPFGGDTTAQDLPTTDALGLAIVHGRRRAGPTASRVPRGVRRAIERGLAIDPAERWPTVEALLDAIERAARAPRQRAIALAATLLVIASVAAIVLVGRALLTRNAPSAPELLSRGEETIAEPPAVLPDGTLVVASDRSGVRQLVAISDRGQRQYEIAQGTAVKHHPHVVGQWLYFLRDATTGRDLVRVPVSSPTAAADVVTAGVGFATAAPDGTLAGTDEPLRAWGGPRALWIEDTRGRRVLYEAGGDELRWVTWSPDGRELAIVRRPPGEDHDGTLWILDREGAARELARDISAPAGVSWRGHRLLVFRGQGAERRLVEIDADGGDERTLVPGTRGGLFAVPVGDKIAYVEDSTDWGLWQTTGGPLRRLSFAGDAAALSPAWVATGELAWLVEAGEKYEVVRASGADLATVRARRAIPTPTSSVAFSSDGKRALYGTYRGDESILEEIELDGAAPARALARANRPAHFLSPQYLRGDRVGYVVKAGPNGASSIWDSRTDGSDAVRRFDGAWNGTRSDDGRWIVLGRDGHGTEMWVLAMDGSAPERSIGPARSVRFDARTGELLVVGDGLDAIDPITGARRHLADWPPGTSDVDRIAPHPDGHITCALAVGRAAIYVVAL